MYLSRLKVNRSRPGLNWMANPYRVHQRLMMGCEGEPRLLFRIEEAPDGIQILAQTQHEPDWQAAFKDTGFLLSSPEFKKFEPDFSPGGRYRFRLLANPTVKRQGERLGILEEEEQRAWIERKLETSGAIILGCLARSNGFQKSEKSSKEAATQVHFSVLFEGALQVTSPGHLLEAVKTGIGPAKAYGFGLLSLGRLG